MKFVIALTLLLIGCSPLTKQVRIYERFDLYKCETKYNNDELCEYRNYQTDNKCYVTKESMGCLFWGNK